MVAEVKKILAEPGMQYEMGGIRMGYDPPLQY